MKAKIYVEEHETLEQAEETLEKALKVKKECSHGERYADKPLNDFHDLICQKHSNLVENILEEVKQEIIRDVSGRGHS